MIELGRDVRDNVSAHAAVGTSNRLATSVTFEIFFHKILPINCLLIVFLKLPSSIDDAVFHERGKENGVADVFSLHTIFPEELQDNHDVTKSPRSGYFSAETWPIFWIFSFWAVIVAVRDLNKKPFPFCGFLKRTDIPSMLRPVVIGFVVYIRDPYIAEPIHHKNFGLRSPLAVLRLPFV